MIAADVSPELQAVFARAAQATIEVWRRDADPASLAVMDHFGRR